MNERQADDILRFCRAIGFRDLKAVCHRSPSENQESGTGLSSDSFPIVAFVCGIYHRNFILIQTSDRFPEYAVRAKENGAIVFAASSRREVSANLAKIFVRDFTEARQKLKLLP